MRVFALMIVSLAGCSLENPFPKLSTPYPDAGYAECMAQNPSLSKSECDVESCLSPQITLVGLKRLLTDIAPVFTAMKLRYWLDGASIYGGIRFNAFIPWDDDVDVSVIAGEFEPRVEELRGKLAALGYELHPVYSSTNAAFRGFFGGSPDFWQVIMTKPVLDGIQLSLVSTLSAEFLQRSYMRYLSADYLPHLDIFVFDDHGDSLFMRAYNMSYPKAALLGPDGPGQLTILGSTYSMPYNPDLYASTYIGKTIVIKDDVAIQREHGASSCSNKIRFKNFSTSLTRKYLCEYLTSVFPNSGVCPQG
jgi:hypothetical protein